VEQGLLAVTECVRRCVCRAAAAKPLLVVAVPWFAGTRERIVNLQVKQHHHNNTATPSAMAHACLLACLPARTHAGTALRCWTCRTVGTSAASGATHGATRRCTGELRLSMCMRTHTCTGSFNGFWCRMLSLGLRITGSACLSCVLAVGGQLVVYMYVCWAVQSVHSSSAVYPPKRTWFSVRMRAPFPIRKL
jgi:hypothetical protein